MIMRKISFVDILNVERELKTCIDTMAQVSGLPFWDVLIRTTNDNSEWHSLPQLNGKRFQTEYEAYRFMLEFVSDLIRNASKLGKTLSVVW